MPIGHCTITLEEVSSFAGNRDINSLEAVLDSLFDAVVTVSIEGQELRYCKKEKQALIEKIVELQKEGDKQ